MADSSDEPIRVICGPTAAGKTRLAVRLATIADISVVSADSRQVYRGFDVGTSKPSAIEKSLAPHFGVDVLDPTERTSAAWWAEHADRWITDIVADGRMPVVVGGTGLYLRALFGTLFEEPEMDPARRTVIQAALANYPTDELRRWVSELDAPRAHLGRTQLLRAIEIALITGHRVSDLHRENVRAPRRRARYLVASPLADALGRVIESRTHQMFLDGWAEEVEALIRQVAPDAPAWNATGYSTVRALVEGRLTRADAEERIVIATRQYAKRQRTWFRHQLPGADVTWLTDEHDDWDARLLAWWNGEIA